MQWAEGDRVRVLRGPFADFQGTVCGRDGEDFVVQVDVFGRTTPVSLRADDIGLVRPDDRDR